MSYPFIEPIEQIIIGYKRGVSLSNLLAASPLASRGDLKKVRLVLQPPHLN